MKTLQSIVLYVLFLISTSLSYAQEVSIELTLERDSIIVGDQVDLTISIAYSKWLNLNFPAFGDTLTPGIEIVARSTMDTLLSKKEHDLVNVICTYTLTSFDGGVIYSLPKIQMLLQNGETVDTFSSNEVQLKVAFPPMDSTFTPHDIKLPLNYPITFIEAFPYVFGSLLFIVIIVFLFYYLQQCKKNQPLFFKPKPKEAAHIIALRELDKIKREQLWQQGKVKEFHTRLSEITRNYLEQRYAVQAMEQTSEEILRALKTDSLCHTQWIDKLSEIFAVSDLAKFANYAPQSDENELCFARVHQFVEQTLQEDTSVNVKDSNQNNQ
ncbi:MAG: hypothetical protein ACRC9X_07490 [Bacteroidales bacterium]